MRLSRPLAPAFAMSWGARRALAAGRMLRFHWQRRAQRDDSGAETGRQPPRFSKRAAAQFSSDGFVRNGSAELEIRANARDHCHVVARKYEINRFDAIAADGQISIYLYVYIYTMHTSSLSSRASSQSRGKTAQNILPGDITAREL